MSLQSLFGRRSRVFDPLSLDVNDPLQDIRIAPDTNNGRDVAAVSTIPTDWMETLDDHIYKADLPGLKKEEVKIEVQQGRILQISGQRGKQENENCKVHRLERPRGEFILRIGLPYSAKVEELKAIMEDGVLTITVPKHPPVITIQLSPSRNADEN